MSMQPSRNVRVKAPALAVAKVGRRIVRVVEGQRMREWYGSAEGTP